MRAALQRLVDRLNGATPHSESDHDCREHERWTGKYWEPPAPGERDRGYNVTYECQLDGNTRTQWEPRAATSDDWELQVWVSPHHEAEGRSR